MRDAGFADFDFLIGEWTITNEFLKQRLVGATEWETFPATSRVEKVMANPEADSAAISTRCSCRRAASPA